MTDPIRWYAMRLQLADPLGPMLFRHLLRKRYLVMARALVGEA